MKNINYIGFSIFMIGCVSALHQSGLNNGIAEFFKGFFEGSATMLFVCSLVFCFMMLCYPIFRWAELI